MNEIQENADFFWFTNAEKEQNIDALHDDIQTVKHYSSVIGFLFQLSQDKEYRIK